MKKIVMLMDLPEYYERIKAAAPDWEVVFTTGKEDAAAHLAEAEIVGGSGSLVRDICINEKNALRWVQLWSAGVDMLPLDIMKKRGLYLTTASGVHGNQISETVFGMMLAFARGLNISFADQQNNFWNQSESMLQRLFEIHGLTIGIVGAGTVGSEIARLAKAFNMRVLGFRRSGAPSEFFDEMFAAGQEGEMLSQSDFVINILPLTPETKGFMNDKRFSKMKPEAYYINVGRGPTTDQEALVRALEGKKIAGAGLDVSVPEPLPSDSPLWQMKNVIITPHSAGRTPYYDSRAMDIFIENLKAYVAGGKPVRSLVDYERSY